MKAINVDLNEDQMEKVQPAVKELRVHAASGHPGMMLAQVHNGKMRVFVIDEEKALKFAEILGVRVVRPD